ncbi:motility protein MotB, partial [Klebsiella pneumoniae]
TVLVLNKETQQRIEHENGESNALEISQPDTLPKLVAPAPVYRDSHPEVTP